MTTPDNNFDFDALKAQFEKMSEQVERYKNDAQQAEKRAEVVEERIINAERLTKEAEEKYTKALELKDGQYEQLIHDLFKAPQEELLHRMENHSKKSFKIALSTAIGSIVVGLVISLILQNQSSKASQDLIQKMEQSLLTTNALIGKIDSVNEDIWATDERIKNFAEVINEKIKPSGCCKSLNDVALLFKVRLYKRNSFRGRDSKKFSSSTKYESYLLKYSDYLKALRVSNIPKEFLPQNESELETWDREYGILCTNALSQLRDKMNQISSNNNLSYGSFSELVSDLNSNSNSNIFSTLSVSDSERAYSTYQGDNDKTEYGSLTWESFRYHSLVYEIRSDLERIERRIRFNKG